MPSPFDNYLFIEKSKPRADELQSVIQTTFPHFVWALPYPRRGCQRATEKKWCKERNWKKERAVVFFDPYGMQVEWSTVETLGETKVVDLWYLFPLGNGVARLLTRDGNISEAWRKRLEEAFVAELARDRKRCVIANADVAGA